jgi:hypothetical protein
MYWLDELFLLYPDIADEAIQLKIASLSTLVGRMEGESTFDYVVRLYLLAKDVTFVKGPREVM